MRDRRLGTPSRYRKGDAVLFSAGASRNRPGVVLDVRPESHRVPERYLISYRFYLPQQRTPENTISPTILCLRSQLLLVLDDKLSEEEFLRMTPPEVQSRYFTQKG